MFDFHCHFFNNEKVSWYILNNGLNPKTNRIVLNSKKENYFVALGIHPIEVTKLGEDEIENELYFIEEKLKKNEIDAIGEVGLDYFWIKDPKYKDFQKELFERFIELAEKYKKPIVIHSRDAEEDVISMIESTDNLKIVLHSFNYRKEELTKRIIDYFDNVYFTVSFSYSKKFKSFINNLPLERTLLESDYPYKKISKTVEDAKKFMERTIELIGEIKGIPKEEVEKILDNNSFNLLKK
jgi:TatD DNase family protein